MHSLLFSASGSQSSCLFEGVHVQGPFEHGDVLELR